MISSCMIVKNEERFLPACLASQRGLAGEIIVVDTGSTDRTVEIAKEHGAIVLSAEWTGDFAAARNVGLERARGDFILYIDADEEVHGDDKRGISEALESGRWDALTLQVVSRLAGGKAENVISYLRIFRNYDDVRFEYPIHEQVWRSLEPHAPRVLESAFRILHHGYDQSEEVLRDKQARNLAAARAVLEREPDNAFFLFHVGLGHLQIGEPAAAIPYLERAVSNAAAGSEVATALAALGQSHADVGAHGRAIEPLERSIAACPEQRWSWALLGECHRALDHHAASAAALESCLAVTRSRLHTDFQPPREIVFMKLSLARLLAGKPAEAADALEESVRLGLSPELQKQTLGVMERVVAAMSRRR